ncbi:DUF6879 family protein [Plantactinospora sp. KLBMP9567]|uniref:DUF6879 family protein n=1 Tax=Plantactinospora sp. KLBMP9567 TaxID=3085900 RepID=UPI002982117D|nr:DUF6879 family protein [Plantactinospora sp. KLBMP9567]MDW5325354.1 hypothetical protein [Plantactinospora sp. KLBMP9567]
MDELIDLLRNTRQSVFRLETLSSYTAAGEAELLRAFEAGLPLPPRGPDTDPWLRMVADSVRDGTSWSRVHVLDRPLSDYLRFELLGYQGNVAAGEDVRIAERATHPEALNAMTRDFWLLDEALAVIIEYDHDGRRLTMEPTKKVSSFVGQRDIATRYSVPLLDYLPLVQHEIRRSW